MQGCHSSLLSAIVGVCSSSNKETNDSRSVVIALIFVSIVAVATESHLNKRSKALLVYLGHEPLFDINLRSLINDELNHLSVTILGGEMQSRIQITVFEHQHLFFGT